MGQYRYDAPGSSASTDGEREPTYRAHHDMTEDGLTVTVAMALEEATGVEATQVISDFSTYVDPDALCRLFRVRPDVLVRETGRVDLLIEGHDVRIYSDGDIEIRRRPES